MQLIDRINSTPRQTYTLITDGGDTIVLELRYLPMQQKWMMNLVWGTWQLNGWVLVVGDNIIRSFKNNVPFGICITSTDGVDPYYLDDFTTGRIKFYLLNATEVVAVENQVYNA